MTVRRRLAVHVTGAVAAIVLSGCVLPASAQTLAERVEANGDVTVNGTPVTMGNSAMWPLRDQAEFLIFATAKEGGANRFELTGDSAGIFEVERNGLKPLLSSTSRNREIEGVPLESILAKIRESLSR